MGRGLRLVFEFGLVGGAWMSLSCHFGLVLMVEAKCHSLPEIVEWKAQILAWLVVSLEVALMR